MKASRSVIIFVVVLGLSVTGSLGGTVTLLPISASGTHTIVGDEIRLTGAGQRVFLEIFLSGWTPDQLKTWQATIDCATYTSGAVGSLAPANVPCGDNATCVAAFGTGSACGKFCNGGTNDGQLCASDPQCPGGTCDFVRCEAGFQDTTRPDWVFAGITAIPAVNTFVCDFAYGATTLGTNAVDDGTLKYGGTLVIDASTDASGTFTIGFIEGLATTFMSNQDNFNIPVDVVTARVTILCDTAADCDDGSACTTDTCDAQGVCANTPNYNPAIDCCNPANGNLMTLSDGIECTQDLCDVQTGIVTHPAEDPGTACGDPSNSQCDNPDTCDGAGNCDVNLELPGTACGSPTNTDCNLADTCDGAGVCLDNIPPAGTACGDPSSGPCDDPDTCNGLGACLVNQTPNGTPCDDGLFCTENTTCAAGACAGGNALDCADSLSCTTDSCNEGTDQCDHTLNLDSCLITGVCYAEGALNPANTCEACESLTDPNNWTVLADGTECNDGDACTGTGRPGIGVDECTLGVCIGQPDPECNDQCAFAVPAVEGVNLSDNSSAGPDDGEASCQIDSNNDVWFEYTATCDGLIFISTTGSAMTPINDPVLSVYTACPTGGGTCSVGSDNPGAPCVFDLDCPNGTCEPEIACDDDSGLDLNAALTFPALAGVTYLIRVAGFEANAGPIVLNLRPFDDCLISGVCYQEDELNPENPCQSCLPDLTTTNWSNVAEGTACGDPLDDECNSPDACNGLGVCELNWKPDGTACPDEPNACTQDFCVSGNCTHPPEAAGLACGDPTDTDCDNPDTCDGGGTCVDNFEGAGFACGDQSEDECDNPNICDGSGGCLENLKPDGTPCDDFDVCTNQGACDAGVCIGVPIPEAPLVVGYGPLALRVTPQPAGSVAPVALHLTSPRWPCVNKYIDFDGSLINAPVFQLPNDWSTVTVRGLEIAPSETGNPSDYDVVAECGVYFSPAGSGATWVWGDLNNDNTADFIDISLIVDAWRDSGDGFMDPDPLFDLHPCPPDDHIDFRDIAAVVDAFRGEPYPCPPPCP